MKPLDFDAMDKIMQTIRSTFVFPIPPLTAAYTMKKNSVNCFLRRGNRFFSPFHPFRAVTLAQLRPHRAICVNLVEIATNNSAQIIFMFDPVLSYVCLNV